MRRVLLAAGLAAAAVGCSDLPDISIPEPPTTAVPTTTTAAPDYSAVALPEVRGATTTTVPVLTPGRATLEGTVAGPDGGVPGATVRLERLVGDLVGTADVTVGLDGSWKAEGIKGGRYRVRAWRAPDLVTDGPVLLFLEEGDPRRLDLRLEDRQGPVVRADVAPRPVLVDEPANLVVLVAVRSVDEQGIVRSEPAGGVGVTLVASGDWRVRTPNPTATDGGGEARWQVVCRSAGRQPIDAVVSGVAEPFPLDVGDCEEPAPPATFAPATTSTSTPSGRTTTTRRTTTTTTPRD